MRSIRNIAVAAVLASFLATTFAFAQGPIIKMVTFDINVPYQLRMANYELPEGHYILRQISQNDINLFSLYKDDLLHRPVAVVRTIRVPATGLSDLPQKTEMLLRDNESGSAAPIMRGFTIPGEDAFQIISVVPNKNSMLVRVN